MLTLTATASLVNRILDRVSRLFDPLDLALELKGLDPENARRLLERHGLIQRVS